MICGLPERAVQSFLRAIEIETTNIYISMLDWAQHAMEVNLKLLAWCCYSRKRFLFALNIVEYSLAR